MKRLFAPGWTAGFLTGISTAGLVALLVLALVIPINIGLSGTSAQVEITPEADTSEESASAPIDAVEVVQRVSPAVVTVIGSQAAKVVFAPTVPVPVPSSTDTESPSMFAAMRSTLPSPVTSAVVAVHGRLPTR